MVDFLKEIMERYRNFDRNADRDPAIISLEYLNFEPNNDTSRFGRLVLVLVESRLLNSTLVPHYLITQLISRLERFKGDLQAEGYTTRFINADLYHGDRHQDGRTLLAIRSFFKEVNRTYSLPGSWFPKFVGVVLVGAFPEASIVRNVMWKPGFKNQVIGGIPTGDNTYLAIGSELIAPRSEIVLGDLNGNWETLYNENSVAIEKIRALPDESTANTDWPVDGQIFVSKHFDRTTDSYIDFFYVDDADYQIIPTNDPLNTDLWISIRRKRKDPEIATGAINQPNPIAIPDIMVSRINALQVAVNPDPSIIGNDGTKPLDANGNPQAFTSFRTYETAIGMFSQDKIFEYRLLCDYFDRNHKFRSGTYSDLPFRVGAIAHPIKDFKAQPMADYLSGASELFTAPVVQEDATLIDYVNWFKEPAVFRHIMAHSNDKLSEFKSGYNVSEFEQVTGGRPFRWHKSGITYTPSFLDQGGTADLFVHRTIWQNEVLKDSGANLIIHGGCEVNSPKETQNVPYYKEGYATFQNGEGILFYMNTIALMARAKVFYDTPRGFPGVFSLSKYAKFGRGWMAYFNIETKDSDLGKFENSIQCKKTYFWSVIGDWSVRLRYEQGLGLLNFVQEVSGGSPIIESVIHSNDSMIGKWHLDAFSNTLHAKGGDMDGNNMDEFLITNNNSLGLIKYENNSWQAITVVNNDDWCGSWRYNSSENEGKDKIIGFWNLLDSNTKSLLIVNESSIGVLQLVENELISAIVQPNGTAFGLWIYDSRADIIRYIGDFDGDGIDEILVTRDGWIGILKAYQGSFTSVFLAPSGTTLGQWLFDSHTDQIKGIGDLDGDGIDEILISNRNSGKIGILKLQGTGLISIVVHLNETDLGGYILNTSHPIWIEGNVINNLVGSIFIREKDVGVHLLNLENGAIKFVATLKFGQIVGTGENTWNFSANDSWRVTGDITGINRSEIFVRNSKGIGILAFQSNNSTFTCNAKYDYGTRMGDWLLEQGDRFGTIQRIVNDRLKTNLLVKKGRFHTDPNDM
jgi:hypothetical protein